MYFSMVKDSHGDFNSNPIALDNKTNSFFNVLLLVARPYAVPCSPGVEAAKHTGYKFLISVWFHFFFLNWPNYIVENKHLKKMTSTNDFLSFSLPIDSK